MTRSSRRGFAMITILWVMTVAGTMAAAAAIVGRNTVNATRNRVHLERALWRASACAARVQADIDARLAAARSYEEAAATWRVLHQMLARPAGPDAFGCVVSLEAAGTRLSVNAASDEMLGNLFGAMGLADAGALVDALADWRDSDDVARPAGAERAWYVAAQRPLPRNGPLADLRELALIRGFEQLTLDTVLSVDSARISLATASAIVLRSVPGITSETAERIVALRDAGTPVTDLAWLVGSLPRASADSLLARYADIVRVTTPDPEVWTLTVRSEVGLPPSVVTLKRRLGRTGRRAVVIATSSDR